MLSAVPVGANQALPDNGESDRTHSRALVGNNPAT